MSIRLKKKPMWSTANKQISRLARSVIAIRIITGRVRQSLGVLVTTVADDGINIVFMLRKRSSLIYLISVDPDKIGFVVFMIFSLWRY